MKPRQFLAVAIVAALFTPLAVHAQQAGYGSQYNIHIYSMAADATDGTANGTGLQNVGSGLTGASGNPFTFAIPANPIAQKYWYECRLGYSQATAAVVDGIGLQFSVAPTASQNFLVVGRQAATAPLSDVAVSITGTSATQVTPSFTPAATATVYPAQLFGFVELPASNIDTVINVLVSQATQGDAITLKRDSFCMVMAVQ